MKEEERALIGVGDDGVRKVLGIPTFSDIPDAVRAPDFVSVTKGNKLALSEAKGGANVDAADAVGQLTNAMKKVKEKGLTGDVDRLEILMQKGAKLQEPYGTKDGYLFHKVEGKTVHIKYFPLLFIKVVAL